MKIERDIATPSAGRPRSFETEQVLDAAMELFWKKGYRTTTTRELEASLGLRQSSIYNAFGSKHDLLEATLDRYENLTTEELVKPLEASSEGLLAIENFFSALSHWVTHDGRQGCMLINMMAEDGGATDDVTRRTRAYRRRVRDALRDALARALDQAETTEADLDGRADLLLGLVLGFNVAARGGASRAELDRLLDAVTGQLESWRLAS